MTNERMLRDAFAVEIAAGRILGEAPHTIADRILAALASTASPTDDVLRVTVNGLWERRHTLTPKDWQDAAPLLLGWLVAALSSAVPTKTDTPSSGEAA